MQPKSPRRMAQPGGKYRRPVVKVKGMTRTNMPSPGRVGKSLPSPAKVKPIRPIAPLKPPKR